MIVRVQVRLDRIEVNLSAVRLVEAATQSQTAVPLKTDFDIGMEKRTPLDHRERLIPGVHRGTRA